MFELRPVAAESTERPQIPPERRKTVTVLFSSAVAAAPRGGKIDPEVRRHVMSRYVAEMQAVLERHGGTVESYPGDA